VTNFVEKSLKNKEADTPVKTATAAKMKRDFRHVRDGLDELSSDCMSFSD
jgi:hypothetical protein